MDGFFVLLGLAAIVAFLLGPIGFFIAIGHGRRLKSLEEASQALAVRLAVAERQFDGAGTGAAFRPETTTVEVAPVEAPRPEAAAPAEASPLEAAAPVEAPPLIAEAEAAEEAPLETPVETPPAPPPQRVASLEERFGARWTVWVGGLATALGALLLVRYSITQGYFGPGARIFLGLLLSVGLLGLGEKLRRGEPAPGPGALPSAPAALTGAGIVAGFGSLYAAYALYGFISGPVAFVALGAVALFALALASLHGPALAGLGFVGAYIAPLLVAPENPSPWPVVLYLVIVGAATYGLARMRRWLWLALAACLGGAAWMLAIYAAAVATRDLDMQHAAEAIFALQGALAALFLAVLPNRGVADQDARLDLVSTAALTLFALLGLGILHTTPGFATYDAVWVTAVNAFVAALALAGVFAAPSALLSVLAGLFVLGALAIWPAADPARALDPYGLLAHWRWPPPVDLKTFSGFAIVAGLAVAGLAGWRQFIGARLPLIPAACYSATAALAPLCVILLADARVADGAPSGPLFACAVVLAGLFAAGASRFRKALAASGSEATRLGLGALASAAIAALAAGMVFAIDGGALTVSLALAALATAYVAIRLEIPALRWCVVGFGVAVAARLAWEPRVVGAALSPTPIFNWLLFGYGAPALAFAFAARIMRQRGEDTPVRVADAMTVLFSAFLVFFEIRHATNGGDPFAPASGLVEQGLMAVSGFGFALVLTRLDAARANPVFRWASVAASVLGALAAAFGLLIRYNPLFDGEPVEGGVILNALAISYLLPALLVGALWLAARRVRPPVYVGAAATLALALAAAYQVLELRVLFQGQDIGFERDFTVAELGLDVSIWLALALLIHWLGARGRMARRYQFGLFAASAIVGLVGLAGVDNPYFSGAAIAGGALFNALLIGYALPAALTALLGRRFGGATMRVAAILWAFAYVTLETRRVFQGQGIGFHSGASDSEIYAYSAVWLLLGLALLLLGVWRASREARYASAFFIVATTLKVFLYDFAGLEGALRAFSFIGLGLVLIGIGLVYQKWVFAGVRAPVSEPQA